MSAEVLSQAPHSDLQDIPRGHVPLGSPGSILTSPCSGAVLGVGKAAPRDAPGGSGGFGNGPSRPTILFPSPGRLEVG